MKKIATFVIGFVLVCGTAAYASCISKAQAESDALRAVGGGTVLLAVYEGADYPPHWSVDVRLKDGSEDEVWVSCSGTILKIIKGQTPIRHAGSTSPSPDTGGARSGNDSKDSADN